MNKKLRMVSFVLLAALAFATQKESFAAVESPPADVIRMAPTYKDVVYATVANDAVLWHAFLFDHYQPAMKAEGSLDFSFT